MEVSEEGEEGVIVEDADVVSFILVEDVREVDFEQAFQEAAEHRIETAAFLNTPTNTSERYKPFLFISPAMAP